MSARLLLKLRSHWSALAAALLVALFVASPIIVFPYVAGSEYRGINIMHFGSDEYLYLVRGKDALEGNRLGQPFLAEVKSGQDPTFSYAEKMLVAPLRILGVSERVNIVTYYNILNFISVVVIVLLMYAFALRLSGNRAIALAGAVFAITGYSITEAHTLFYSSYDVYGRSVFPFMSSIPFFGFLIALHEALVVRRDWRSSIVAGFILGLLCYIYFHAWAFAFALVAALALLYALLRDWPRVIQVCAIGALGAVLGAYNIIQLFLYVGGPFAAQLSYFYYAIEGHFCVMSNTGLATAVLLLILVYRRGRDANTPFIAAVIAAGWIAVNQQIITGRVVQYGHYFWYFISPLSIIIAAYLLWRLLPPRLARVLPILIIGLGFFNIAGQQYRAFRADVPAKLQEQVYAPIIEELNTLPNGVILAGGGGESDTFLIPIYTDHDLYWTSAAVTTQFSMDRFKEALLLHLFLNRDSRNDPKTYLQKALQFHMQNEYTLMYTEIEGFYSGLDYKAYQRALTGGETSFGGLRERLLDELTLQYKRGFNSVAVEQLLKEAGVRYIIWDSSLYPEWDLSIFKDRKEITRSGNVVLYEFDGTP